MFSFLNFKWVLKFVYSVAKYSGFLFTSIDFDSKQLKVISCKYNYAIFLASFGLSLAANFYPGYLPVADVAHSKILEIGVNLIIKALLVVVCVLKIAVLFQNDKFFFILSNMQRVHEKVKLTPFSDSST